MIGFFFAILAAGANSGAAGDMQADAAAAPLDTAVVTQTESAALQPLVPSVTSPTVSIGSSVTTGAGVIIGGGAQTSGAAAAIPVVPVAAEPDYNMAVVPAGLVAEPQTPSGKFTTATEIKPILGATKGNWVAVREYDGKDLLYITHLWSWRCGLAAVAISVNNEPMQNWPLPPCHLKYATPNAVLPDDGLPYLTMRLGSVQQIAIQIVYDDLSMDRATFDRGTVLIP